VIVKDDFSIEEIKLREGGLRESGVSFFLNCNHGIRAIVLNPGRKQKSRFFLDQIQWGQERTPLQF
jgi:hypothetical protein